MQKNYTNCTNCNTCPPTTLICQPCTIKHHNLQQLQNQLQKSVKRVAALRQSVESKLGMMDMKKAIKTNQYQVKYRKSEAVRQRIEGIKAKLEEERSRRQGLLQISKHMKQYMVIPQSDVYSLFLDQLVKDNRLIQNKFIAERNQKLITLDRIANIFDIPKKRFMIDKYFAYKIKEINFVLESVQIDVQNENKYQFSESTCITNSNTSPTKKKVKVIKRNYQQQIEYNPMILLTTFDSYQQKPNQRNEQKQQMLFLLKNSTKLFYLTHKIFFSNTNLPYSMYFSKNLLYIGNSVVNFSNAGTNSDLQIDGQGFKKVINMLQSNLQYMAYTLGHPNRPFLLFTPDILTTMQANAYRQQGFRQSREWVSKLKYLGMETIEENYQQEYVSNLIIINENETDDLVMEGIGTLEEVGYKKSASSDDQFQILE